MASALDLLLLSAIISGLVSILVNLISYLLRRRIRRRDQRQKEIQNWRNDIITICRQIRRKAYELEYNIEIDPMDKKVTNSEADIEADIETLDSLIAELNTELDRAPHGLRGSNTADAVEKLSNWYRSPRFDVDTFTTTELKKELILLAEDVMDKAYGESDTISKRPY